MDDILKLGHIYKAFFRDIARIVDDWVDNPGNKKRFSERLKTFRKKREQFCRALTKWHEAAENPKFQLSEEERKKHLAGEELRPHKKGWLIDSRLQPPQTSPLRKALSDANIDYSRFLLWHSSPLMRKARSDSIKALSDLNIDLPSPLKKELSDTDVEPDSDEYRKLFDIIKATRPDLIDSNFDARNESPLMVMAKVASALELEALENTTAIYFWRPPLPFNPDRWLSYHYESGAWQVSSQPERPESKVERLACQYELLAVIHDNGLEEIASDEWLTTTDDEQWANPLWTKISTTAVSPDGPDEKERRTRIEQALAMVKADLASKQEKEAEKPAGGSKNEATELPTKTGQKATTKCRRIWIWLKRHPHSYGLTGGAILLILFFVLGLFKGQWRNWCWGVAGLAFLVLILSLLGGRRADMDGN